MESLSSPVCNLGVLDTIGDDSVQEIIQSYTGFCAATDALLNGSGDLSAGTELITHVQTLCNHGLRSLGRDHFLNSLEQVFERNGALKFWLYFDAFSNISTQRNSQSTIYEDDIQQVLYNALEEICSKKQYQEKCLMMLVHALDSYKDSAPDGGCNAEAERMFLFSKYQLMVSSTLMASLPRHFPGVSI